MQLLPQPGEPAMPADPLKGYPEPSVRRLPLYLRLLKQLQAKGRDVVSCTHISDDLGFTSIQVRKDLAMTGIVGRPKIGYEIPSLIQAIEDFLGWNNVKDAFLVGAGSLGHALLGYPGFDEYGLNIVAAFDNDPAKIGRTVHGKEILPIERLENLARRMHVLIGILTVPGEAAQPAADLMVRSGIRAIWNYAPAKLDVPEFVVVEDVRLAASLAVLTKRLKEAMHHTANNDASQPAAAPDHRPDDDTLPTTA